MKKQEGLLKRFYSRFTSGVERVDRIVVIDKGKASFNKLVRDADIEMLRTEKLNHQFQRMELHDFIRDRRKRRIEYIE